MVNPEATAESIFMQYATLAVLFIAGSENIFANKTYSGAPGGCPTCKPYPTLIHSPQSQKLTDGSSVSVYTAVDITNTNNPITLLYR